MIQLPSTVSKFVWHYVKQRKLVLLGFIFVALFWSFELSFSPYLLGKMIDIVTNVTDKQSAISLLVLPASLYASMSVLLNIVFRFYNYLTLSFYPKLKADITNDMFDYLLGHSYGFFQDNFSGKLTKKISDMATNVEQLIQIPNEWFYPRLLSLIFASITLYVVVTPIFSVILFLWGLSFVGLTYVSSKTSETYARTLSDKETSINGILQDSISNAFSVKLFTAENLEKQRLSIATDDMVVADQKLQWQNIKIYFIQSLGVTVLISSMLWALIFGYQQGSVTAGDFALVLSLSINFIMGVFNVGQELLRFTKIVGSSKESLSFIREPHQITDSEKATKLVVNSCELIFSNVSFSYQKEMPFFKDFNLKITEQERVGLIGFSGGGKTTLTRLLLRLIEPISGELKINGVNINAFSKQSLRENIGIIPQETELFHRSILDNLRFAKPDANEAQIISAAKAARCHDFIMSLPQGYQSIVGEKGVKLSGGQRQRLAIARAFLKDAPILILDEATSALDSVTEHEIQESLHEVMQGRTCLVIAHRLSTLKDMSRIIVLDNGCLIEEGSPQTLLNNENSTFRRLWAMQSNSFIL